MSLEWLKQYILWGLIFFVISIILVFIYFGITELIKIIKRHKRNIK